MSAWLGWKSLAAIAACASLASAQRTLLTLEGETEGDAFGDSVCELGDLDLDGTPDIAVGAPGRDEGAADGGAVYVFSGATGSLLAKLVGSTAGELIGTSMAAAGDVDGDGSPDLALGTSLGRAYFVSVATGATIQVFSGAGSFGSAVSAGSDLDCDGVNDVVLDGGGGSIVACSGSSGAVLHTWTGVRNGNITGDLDGDGVDDVLAVTDDDVFAFSGLTGATLFSIHDPDGNDVFGLDVAGRFDADGDGLDDIAVGSVEGIIHGGLGYRAYVFGGASHALMYGPMFGRNVTGLGDFDGDGRDDFAMSDQGAIYPAVDSRVEVDSGATGQTIAALVQECFDQFGSATAAIGDLDGDGRADLLVGALSAMSANGRVGKVYAFAYGPSCELPYPYCNGQVSSENCYTELTWTGQPSMSAGSGFMLFGSELLPNVAAILIYSTTGPASIPFQGGTLCVASPVHRTRWVNTGGAEPCSGTAQIDFNGWIARGLDPSLHVGAQVFAQAWSRDGASAGGSNLTRAVRFHVCP